jgi:anionic cell wall polymer biosynthesis LytR-Cps2A-Psr (LCP) family protein
LPRKIQGEKLEKVVSTNISLADFDLLKKYARINYEVNVLTLPTVSHMLRAIVKNWVYITKMREKRTGS